MHTDAPSNRLRELREARGITIRQVAQACDVYDSTAQRWQGAFIPQQHLPRIAALLGVTVPQLAGWEPLPSEVEAA
jgi:transcriptional regulator with XRE-family HTH domain